MKNPKDERRNPKNSGAWRGNESQFPRKEIDQQKAKYDKKKPSAKLHD